MTSQGPSIGERMLPDLGAQGHCALSA
jgi:hypothetical protein